MESNPLSFVSYIKIPCLVEPFVNSSLLASNILIHLLKKMRERKAVVIYHINYIVSYLSKFLSNFQRVGVNGWTSTVCVNDGCQQVSVNGWVVNKNFKSEIFFVQVKKKKKRKKKKIKEKKKQKMNQKKNQNQKRKIL